MKADEFNALTERRVELIRSVLVQKAKEYATNDDRLHNFKVSAGITRESPEEVLLGFWSKHLTSVIDLIKDGRPITRDYLDEKIGDTINYAILLEALLVELRITAA